METKNICGKIPVELHEKVREELEGTEMTIPQFLQKVKKIEKANDNYFDKPENNIALTITPKKRRYRHEKG